MCIRDIMCVCGMCVSAYKRGCVNDACVCVCVCVRARVLSMYINGYVCDVRDVYVSAKMCVCVCVCLCV